MKLPNNLGMFLLGLWLVLTGAMALLDIHLGKLALLMPLLAVAAGIALLLGR